MKYLCGIIYVQVMNMENKFNLSGGVKNGLFKKIYIIR
jgi:hypothetical protein